MYAERGAAYACAAWLQAPQYLEQSFAWKHNPANKWAQSLHVSIQDTSDGGNKERNGEKDGA